jgi:hypothetical protein
MRRALAALCAFAAIAPAAGAADPAVESCMSAHERGQKHALEGAAASAMKEYAVCARTQCPKLVREDCSRRLARATEEAPTLRLEVSGIDAEDVRVSIDGGEAEPLGDEPVFVDPGSHRVRFVAGDGRESERSVEVSSGEKDVRVVATFAAARSEPEADPAPAEPRSAGPSPAVWIFGGLAVVGIAGFVGFGLAGKSKQAELDDCKPSCSDGSLYDDMHRNYVIADVSLAIGLGSAALAAYFYVDGNRSQRVGLTPAGRGGLVTWDASF